MYKALLAAMLAPIAFASAYGKPLSPPHEANAERTEEMCKLEAQGMHRKGQALDREVQRCVSQESPNLAYWEHCRQSAHHRHLRGLALRQDVDACMDREP